MVVVVILCSHTGLFDWLLGRQGYNWTNQRFIREYSGMSLRGLMWTMPQGYALEQMGFGWEYSLTGVLMPFIYYVGDNSHVSPHRGKQSGGKVFIDSPLATSEFLWGLWLWFVLIQASLTQLVRRARIWIYKRNPHLEFKPFSVVEKIKYESLNRTILRGLYEALVLIVTTLYCFTTIYYSLIEQADVRNKGQTFFGLFMTIIFQVVVLGWMWGVRYRNFILKRYARKIRGRTTTNNAIYNGSSSGSSNNNSAGQSLCEEEGPHTPEMARAASVSTLTSGIDHYDALSQSISPSYDPPPSRGAKSGGNGSKKPLLSWPYSHPDRLSPTEEQRQQVLDLSGINNRHYSTLSFSTFASYWRKLERYVWLDMFILMRRTIGLLTLFGTIFSLMMTVTATILGRDNARFVYELDPPCRNTTF